MVKWCWEKQGCSQKGTWGICFLVLFILVVLPAPLAPWKSLFSPTPQIIRKQHLCPPSSITPVYSGICLQNPCVAPCHMQPGSFSEMSTETFLFPLQGGSRWGQQLNCWSPVCLLLPKSSLWLCAGYRNLVKGGKKLITEEMKILTKSKKKKIYIYLNLSEWVYEVFRKHPKLQRTSWESILGGKACTAERSASHAILSLIPHYPLGSLITEKITFSQDPEALVLWDKRERASRTGPGWVRKQVNSPHWNNFFLEVSITSHWGVKT